MHDRRLDAWLTTPEQRKEFFNNPLYNRVIRAAVNGELPPARLLFDVCIAHREAIQRLEEALVGSQRPIVIQVQDSPDLRAFLAKVPGGVLAPAKES